MTTRLRTLANMGASGVPSAPISGPVQYSIFIQPALNMVGGWICGKASLCPGVARVNGGEWLRWL